jgi:hypothetical protein
MKVSRVGNSKSNGKIKRGNFAKRCGRGKSKPTVAYPWLVMTYAHNSGVGKNPKGTRIKSGKGRSELMVFQPCEEHKHLKGKGQEAFHEIYGCQKCYLSTELANTRKDTKIKWNRFPFDITELRACEQYCGQNIERPLKETPLPKFIKDMDREKRGGFAIEFKKKRNAGYSAGDCNEGAQRTSAHYSIIKDGKVIGTILNLSRGKYRDYPEWVVLDNNNHRVMTPKYCYPTFRDAKNWVINNL